MATQAAPQNVGNTITEPEKFAPLDPNKFYPENSVVIRNGEILLSLRNTTGDPFIADDWTAVPRERKDNTGYVAGEIMQTDEAVWEAQGIFTTGADFDQEVDDGKWLLLMGQYPRTVVADGVQNIFTFVNMLKNKEAKVFVRNVADGDVILPEIVTAASETITVEFAEGNPPKAGEWTFIFF